MHPLVLHYLLLYGLSVEKAPEQLADWQAFLTSMTDFGKRCDELDGEIAQLKEQLLQQSRGFEAILNNIGDGLVVTDAQGQIRFSNPTAAQILTVDPAVLLPGAGETVVIYQQDGRTPYLPDDLPLMRAMRGEHIDAAEFSLARNDQSGMHWFSITARPLLNERNEPDGSVAVFRDISTAKHTEVALRISEERYALAARGANDGLWDWDILTDQVYYSARWKAMLGYEEDAIGVSPNEWFDRVHPDDLERLRVHLAAHFRRLLTNFEAEYRIRNSNGDYRWMVCRGLSVWDERGQVTRLVGSQTDITDRKLAEQQLIYDALHDALTGLPNRILFMDRLKHTLERFQRKDSRLFAVLFLDLDRFKIINDSLGHAAGDRLLIAAATRLRSCLRSSDTIARLGGDEFTILLEELDDSDIALHVAERILNVLMQPFYIDGQEIFTSTSIGVALSTAAYERPEELLRDADMAMYHAKLQGKARYAVFDSKMHADIRTRLQRETDLRRALERQEFLLYYEPIVALRTGAIVGFEALIRWRHPQHGLVSPAEFIPIAEETGLIVPIGAWVLREACRQMHSWQLTIPAAESFSISVNISARQWTQPDLVELVWQTLQETGLPADSLKLEITENILIENGEAIRSVITRLQDLGVKVCLDDFGTGYSSLSYLHRFPIDVLKIDRSFVSRIGANGENAELVQTIMAMARALKITAIAEGTETEAQLNKLQQIECEYGQGWLFARAMDGDAAAELIRSWSER